MTDSPATGRHRRKPRRGVLGPAVSALSVLLATAPVAWVMAGDRGDSVTDRQATLKHLAEEDLGTERGSDAITDTGEKRVTVTLPQGKVTTATRSTPSAGTALTTTETPAGTPSAPVTTTTAPRVTTTVTVRPTTRPTTTRPSRSATRPTAGPTRTATKAVTSTPPTTQPPPADGGTSAQEREVLDLVNAIRRNSGCGDLSLEGSLVRAAGGHASDMVDRHYFSHDTPEGRSAFDRMRAEGWRGSAAAENIAAGYDSPRAVVRGWMESDGHRANILNCNYNKTGIGYDPGKVKSGWGAGSWVQDFGRN